MYFDNLIGYRLWLWFVLLYLAFPDVIDAWGGRTARNGNALDTYLCKVYRYCMYVKG